MGAGLGPSPEDELPTLHNLIKENDMVAPLVLVIMGLVGTQALAGTDRDKFESAIKKYATTSGPSKAVCACQDGQVNTDGRYGWVRYLPSATAFGHYCSVPVFNPTTGAETVERACYTWVPLAK
jgi:hypothetical protein